MTTRSLQDAQHEAAHVVVGVALGLRVERVVLGSEPEVTWRGSPWPREAGLLMWAAGVAWERRCGDLFHASYDLKDLRRAGVRGNARIRALERAAWAVLMSRAGAHARVTRALLARDLVEADVRRLARCEFALPE